MNYLWAVDCSKLKGFDTETYQQGEGVAKVWRPGEKVYRQIPQTNIIGYIKFKKEGAPGGGGWRFTIPAGTTWQWINRPTSTPANPATDVKDYLRRQLSEWIDKAHTIPADFDFAG